MIDEWLYEEDNDWDDEPETSVDENKNDSEGSDHSSH